MIIKFDSEPTMCANKHWRQLGPRGQREICINMLLCNFSSLILQFAAGIARSSSLALNNLTIYKGPTSLLFNLSKNQYHLSALCIFSKSRWHFIISAGRSGGMLAQIQPNNIPNTKSKLFSVKSAGSGKGKDGWKRGEEGREVEEGCTKRLRSQIERWAFRAHFKREGDKDSEKKHW